MSYLPKGFLPKSRISKFGSAYKFRSNMPLLYQALDIRKNRNQDSIVVVCGEKRSGKSYFCLKTCEDMAKEHNMEFSIENVFYEVDELLLFMNNNDNSIGMMEEAGLLLNAQNWNTIQNKIIRNMTQTQGFRKNIVMFNLPHFAFFDKSMRLMTNYVVKTEEIGRVTVYRVNVQHVIGDGYFTRTETINFKLPSKNIIEQYEAKKKKFNDIWLKEDLDYIQMLTGKKDMPEQIRLRIKIDENTGNIKAQSVPKYLTV